MSGYVGSAHRARSRAEDRAQCRLDHDAVVADLEDPPLRVRAVTRVLPDVRAVLAGRTVYVERLSRIARENGEPSIAVGADDPALGLSAV